MNYSHIVAAINTCYKLDRSIRQRLLNKYTQENVSTLSNCSRSFHFSITKCQSEKDYSTEVLSPQEVTSILRQNEFNQEFTNGPVKSYDSNQLPSNDPIEDMRSEAQCKMIPGLLIGIFDGHGGPACAQVISKRLLTYIATALMPNKVLEEYIKVEPKKDILETFHDRGKIVQDLKVIYDRSYDKYVKVLLDTKRDEPNVPEAMEKGILQLDEDLAFEVLEQYHRTGTVNPKTLSVALSGAVACISYINGPDLHVANIGDCNAVLGTLTDENEWIAKKITIEHNAENLDELKRIWNEHPEIERKTVIRRDRLLGELAPLRSMGDYRYKWNTDILTKVAVPLIGQRAIPANYYTPPYLTSKPDVYYHRIKQRDKFLIIASDGLWDMMTPIQAVRLVGEHMQGKVFFNPLKLPKKNIQLADINELLSHRRESLKSKPKDLNAATHLIRHAIGGTEYGVDHTRLSHLLSLSSDVSRMFRDDMTVTVVYFDSEYLRQCPS